MRKHDRAEIVRRAHALGRSDAEIAALAACSPRQVLRVREALGLPANRDAGNNLIHQTKEAS